DDPDRYKLAKQADTLMLFFLFPEDELKQLFERLGYEYSPETALHNVEYYAKRTSHGSTLSFIVHAAIMADIDPESSWERYMVALESDVGDVQGGTTREAIHMGVMAGTLDLLQRGYMGSEIRDGVLYFAPKLTAKLDGLSFPMRFHQTPMHLTLKGKELIVSVQDDGAAHQHIKVGVGDVVKELKAGEEHTFSL
ncbi:MAG TPA: glycosyl hydrolase family 65 protein, partial [Rubrobacteraceae bacterium]|nr:glycosyl hydrolase family 65 protein [Rubrobacteraceae bacterium]